MTALARAPAPMPTDWLSIREASALVGVSVATLRRWSDAGRVPVFTTPGGHRRFSRDAVLSLVAMPPSATWTEAERSTSAAIVRACRRGTRRSQTLARPLDSLTRTDRAGLRRHGRQIVAALIESLVAEQAHDDGRQSRAGNAAAACGRIAAGAGMTLEETIGVFVCFRAPLLHELGAVCRRRGLDAAMATAILERASDLIDRLLPTVVASFQESVPANRAAPFR